jgi:hypothetical protein
MTTSGTTTYSVTRNDIIFASLRLLGVLEEGSVPSATAIENASMVLNLLIKDWMTDGIKLWTVNEIILPLVDNQTQYTMGEDSSNDLVTAKPLRIIQAILRNNSVNPAVDMPMTIISEQEYNILGSKKSQGNVNTVMYKPYVNHGILSVFLTPNQQVAEDYTLHLNVQRPIQDITSSNQTFDFPQEWYQALRWGLASELAADYGLELQRAGLVIQRAESYKQRLMAWDVENASTFFQPDARMYNPKFR